MQQHEKYLKVKYPDGVPGAPLIPVSNLLFVDMKDDDGFPPWQITLWYKCSKLGKKSKCMLIVFDAPGSTPHEDMKIIIPKAIKEVLSGSENVLEVDVWCVPALQWNY